MGFKTNFIILNLFKIFLESKDVKNVDENQVYVFFNGTRFLKKNWRSIMVSVTRKQSGQTYFWSDYDLFWLD